MIDEKRKSQPDEEFNMMSQADIMNQKRFDNMMNSLELLLNDSDKYIENLSVKSTTENTTQLNDDPIIYESASKSTNTEPVNIEDIDIEYESAILDKKYEEIVLTEENKYESLNLESDILSEHPDSNGEQRVTKRNQLANISDKTKIFGIVIIAIMVVLFILFGL